MPLLHFSSFAKICLGVNCRWIPIYTVLSVYMNILTTVTRFESTNTNRLCISSTVITLEQTAMSTRQLMNGDLICRLISTDSHTHISFEAMIHYTHSDGITHSNSNKLACICDNKTDINFALSSLVFFIDFFLLNPWLITYFQLQGRITKINQQSISFQV